MKKILSIVMVYLIALSTFAVFELRVAVSNIDSVEIERLTNNTFDDFHPDCAVDSFNVVHIAWAGGSDYRADCDIYYACKSATGWKVEKVPRPPNSKVNFCPSIFVDSDGKPHIAWISNPTEQPSTGLWWNWDVWYAVKEGASWTMEQVTHWSSENHFVSLVLDSVGRPHIAWDARHGALWGVFYATKNGGTWSMETVSHYDDASPSIDVDSNNVPHVFYSHIGGLDAPKLRYASKVDGSWIQEEPTGEPGGGDSQRQLLIDKSDVPHIAFSHGISAGHYELWYGNKKDGSWSFSQIRDSSFANVYPSIFLNSEGVPFVVWHSNDAGNYDIYLAEMGDSNWQVTQITEDAIDDVDPSFFIDSEDNIHIVWNGPSIWWSFEGEAEIYYIRRPVRLKLTATIDIHPATLNLRSKGKWITCYIELPEGYNVSGINVTSIMLNDTVPAEMHSVDIGDYDDDGIPDLMVKFDRSAVINLILENYEFTGKFGMATLTVTGSLEDDTPFEDSDTVKIKTPIPK